MIALIGKTPSSGGYKIFRNISVLALTITVILCACSKNPGDLIGDPLDPPPNEDSILMDEPGFGPSTAAFAGAAWELPAGISLLEKMHWLEYCSNDTAWGKRRNWIGVPNTGIGAGLFIICFQFKNNSNHSITIQLPPYLLLQHVSIKDQNGLVLTNRYTFSIPAGGIRNIFAHSFCINKSRKSPAGIRQHDGTLNEYDLGPATLPPALKEIADILEPKNLTNEKILSPNGITNDFEKTMKLTIIQQAIWEVTDGPGLKPSTKQQLLQLTL